MRYFDCTQWQTAYLADHSNEYSTVLESDTSRCTMNKQAPGFIAKVRNAGMTSWPDSLPNPKRSRNDLHLGPARLCYFLRVIMPFFMPRLC